MPRVRMISREQNGFSTTELLIVVAIGMIVTATALPSMTSAIANAKMRASMTSVSGLLQNTRMMAVQQNATKTARNFNRTTTPYSLVYYVKTASDGSSIQTSDSQIEMEAPITPYDAPTGAGAPAAVTNAALGMSTAPLTSDPSFNSRGLPCTYSGGTCTPNVGFIKYFKDNRISNGGWAAISISPAGRIKRWFWNGTSWTD
jgi:Tfp pilus assembly protein FimT